MVTQQQIARKLGVSRQLVTFALAGYPLVAEASRRRILATAAEMGYRHNPHARALKRARTGIIALWVPDLISTHFTHVVRELNRLLKEARQELIVTEVGHRTLQEVLCQVPVDGVIAVDAPAVVRAYLNSGMAGAVPVVSIGAYCFDGTDSVHVDLLAGTRQAMEHLISAGFRRIVHATYETQDNAYAKCRLGYSRAMKAAGLKSEFLCYPFTKELRPMLRELIKEYTHRCGCPEAIFCRSDDAALGMYRGFRDLKLRIPQDVALVGCDGIQDTEYLDCPITTMVQPVAEMCAVAWKFLVQRLDHPQSKRQRANVKPRLVIRESSRAFGWNGSG